MCVCVCVCVGCLLLLDAKLFLCFRLASRFCGVVSFGSIGMHRYVCSILSLRLQAPSSEFPPAAVSTPPIVHPRQCFQTPCAASAHASNQFLLDPTHLDQPKVA